MKKMLLPVLVFTLSFPMLSCAASFDCAKAGNATEKLICSDTAISSLDEQLASSYKQALEAATDKDAFKKTQIDWLKQQRACKDADCLAQTYQARIAELNPSVSSLNNSSFSSDLSKLSNTKQKFKLTRGSQYPLCRDYLALMNRAPRNPENTCGLEYNYDDEAKAKGFKDINWVELDPKENEKLLIRYWKYRINFYANKDNREQQLKQIESTFLPAKKWLWKTAFDLNNDGQVEEVYKLVVGDCTLNRGLFFMPSEVGFSYTEDAGSRIELDHDIIIYQGRTFSVSYDMITEPLTPSNGISKPPEFVNSGPAVCYFELTNQSH